MTRLHDSSCTLPREACNTEVRQLHFTCATSGWDRVGKIATCTATLSDIIMPWRSYSHQRPLCGFVLRFRPSSAIDHSSTPQTLTTQAPILPVGPPDAPHLFPALQAHSNAEENTHGELRPRTAVQMASSTRRFSVGTVLHVDGRGFGLTTRVVTPQTQDGACLSLQVTGHLTPGLHLVPVVMRASDLNDG